ncbi:MAG: hypothetical protein ACQET6_08175 [Bacillota bacterium]|uniref:hypothetical protein n=1 Tax=Rossellomorea aquimaris TaxID=189382 RepID=UPI0005C890D0|nr:hypothetical protein [Rossellomorea aquimaris]
MEVYIITFFSIIIIYRTVHSMIKLFTIAYKRQELSRRKYRWMVTISILTGMTIVSILPFTFQALFT